jgi:predicted nucleic acid-binding protein
LLECGRATRRAASKRLLQVLEEVAEATYLLGITPAIIELAARIDPPHLRSLDAIHLATALSIDDADLEVITYDDRLAAAARANGLTVVQPGRRAARR